MIKLNSIVYSKKPRVFFILFVLFVGLHKSNYLISNIINFNLQKSLGFSLLFFPLIFLFLSYQYSFSKAKKRSFLCNDFFPTLIFIYVHFLLILGIFNGNDLFVIFLEYWTGAIVLFSYLIASDPRIWNTFGLPLRFMYLLFAIATLVATQYSREHLVLQGLGDIYETHTTSSLAYEISPILDFWPFLFLIAFFRNKKNPYNLVALVPFVIYLAFQLYFLKRAPTTRAISYLIVGSLVLIYLKRNTGLAMRLITIFAIILIGIYFITPKALIARFETKDTARQEEALTMINQLSPIEHILGKGLGGSYYLEQGAGLIEIDNHGNYGKNITHVGVAYPYLKGGLIFTLILFIYIIRTIFKSLRKIKFLSDEELAALVFLIVYCSFRLIEGPFSTGAIFDGTLFGLSLGILNLKKVGQTIKIY